jgi:outer membrane protein assembly factor BamB
MTKGKLIAGTVLLGMAVLIGLFVHWGFSDRAPVAGPRAFRLAGAQRPDSRLVSAEDDPEELASHLEPALALRTDPASERKLKAARDYARQEAWAEAVGVVQALLDGPDAFVSLETDAAKKDAGRWTSLHAEADRLIGGLPAPGRAFYELLQGGAAKTLLARAQERADPHLLAEVARRYLHTTAGVEATRRLGVYHLDRGRAALAALYFERLLNLPDADRLTPTALFTAAVAFQRAGDQGRADRTWKTLAGRAPNGVPIGGNSVRLAELRTWLDQDRRRLPPAHVAVEWPLFRGDAARSAPGVGGDLVPQVKWQQAMIQEAATRTWVEEAVRRQGKQGEPVLPAFSPIVANGKVVYRSYRGIHAVDAQTGKQLWESWWQGGLDTLGQELRYFPYIESWVNAHIQHQPEILFGNSVVGTLSTDGERVYAVEDLAVPPYQNTYVQRGRPVAAVEYAFGPGLTEAVRHSRLTALDLKTGKLLWERGEPATQRKKDNLYPSYFLGPPLPAGGRLYGLMEKDQELRLACFEATTGRLVWAMPLGLAPSRLLTDPGRHLQAAPLAYAEGILVCPTNAGFLLALDPVSRSFLWAYSYREAVPVQEFDFAPWGRGGRRGMPTPMPPPRMHPSWAASAPVVASGKVVFTAPDGPSIHCLSLRDGSLQWKVRQTEGDLHLAGVSQGKVVVVGKKACRALDLANGKVLWDVATGLPAGLGTLDTAAYHLPLKTTIKDEEPAIYRIDLDSGRIQEQAVPAREEALGNLISCEDMVLSQTATTIMAYLRRASP